jgi:chromosome segregation ATPase
MTDPENTFEGAEAHDPMNDGAAVLDGIRRDSAGTASARSIHEQLAALRTAPPPADVLHADVPASITSALRSWGQQIAQDAAARVRDSVAQVESEIASLLALNEQADVQRSELDAQLSRITAERDQALARLAERDASIERLTVELRHARTVASEALVGKAKDQLAIEGKDTQLAELRRQIEHHVATFAAQSDARLAAEMELVGATTARDNFAVELAELRAELDSYRAGRGGD